MGSITKEDLKDVDFLDGAELASTESVADAFKIGVTVVSTTAGTKRVVISGFDLVVERDVPVAPGDKAVIAGTTGGADGTYTVNSIVNATTFDVVETIATSTGGTVQFRYPAGAKAIGVNTARISGSTSTTLQNVLFDFDVDFLLDNEPMLPSTNYTATRSGNVVTKEEWKRADTTLLKSIDYTRSGGNVTNEDRKVFALDGTTIIGEATVAYTRSGGVVTSAIYTRVV